MEEDNNNIPKDTNTVEPINHIREASKRYQEEDIVIRAIDTHEGISTREVE